MLKRVIIFIFLCSFFLLRGQQINTSEIRVYESFKPSIPEPKRLNENAIFLDTIQIIITLTEVWLGVLIWVLVLMDITLIYFTHVQIQI